MAGRLIVIDGPDGCGKSTQVARLAGQLRERGHDVITYRNPGSTSLGEKIRGLLLDDPEPITPWTQLLLFAASRSHLYETVVMPALRKGQIVVMDRCIFSTFAYQTAQLLEANDPRAYQVGPMINLIHSNLITTIALYFVISVEPRMAWERLQAAGEPDKIERAGLEFQARVARNYEAAVDYYKDDIAIKVIDGNRAIEAVTADILDEVLMCLPKS